MGDEMSIGNNNADINKMQQAYLSTLSTGQIVTSDKSHQYHAIFGSSILQSFDTEAEAKAALPTFKNIAVAWYIPGDQEALDSFEEAT